MTGRLSTAAERALPGRAVRATTVRVNYIPVSFGPVSSVVLELDPEQGIHGVADESALTRGRAGERRFGPVIDHGERADGVEIVGQPVANATAKLASDLPPLEPMLRLPVAELTAPQLAARPTAERAALAATLDDLARADRTVSVFEYCLARVVGRYLLDAAAPRASASPGHAQIGRVQDAAVTLLAVVAAVGNPDPAAAERAFKAATARMLPGTSVPFTPPADPWTALDAGWAMLNGLDPRHKQVLVESVATAISDDGVVTPSEAELLRCVSTVLGCPLPPLAA